MTAWTLSPARDLRSRRIVDARRFDQPGERSDAGGVDEESARLAQCVVSRGARHGQAGIQRLVDGEDLLDDDPCVRSGQFPKPGQIPCRIGQSVRMVDADPVDQVLGEPPSDLGMAGVEHGAVLLAQPRERGDREEPPVAACAIAPAGQLVVLPVVHFGAGAGAGARQDRVLQVTEPQHGRVDSAFDNEVGHIVVRAQNGQHDSTVGVQVPVDIKVRRVLGIPAVGQHIPPPPVLPGHVDADVVGHDINDDAQPGCACRVRELLETVCPAEFRGHRGGIGDVVAVAGALARGEDRGQVQM